MLASMTDQFSETPDLRARIRHAERYPFARPACSYLFIGHGMHPLPKDAFLDRHPIVASGSNASPERLAAKFGVAETIPVTRGVLRDFAVVFAGHFTAYGSIPATLCPHRGCSSTVWITWLTSDQLSVMHRSEGVIGCREAQQRYDYVELDGLDLHLETGQRFSRAGAYLSRRMFATEGRPTRFAEIFSRGADLPSASEPVVLRRASALLDPSVDFVDFMAGVLTGVDRRQALFRALTPYTIDREKAWQDGTPALLPIAVRTI